jgi:hypothetical protein
MGALVTLAAVAFCVCIGFVAIHVSPSQKPHNSEPVDRR